MDMLTSVDRLVFGLGGLVLGLWLFLFLLGRKNAKLFAPLSEQAFPLKEIYFVGYTCLELFHYRYKSQHDRKLRKQICVLYGEKYGEYYLRVIHAQKMTWFLTLLALAAPMYGLGDSILIPLVMGGFGVLAFYYFGTLTETKLQRRSQQMRNEFSNVVSKLALLTNAGMIMREAWQVVALGGDSLLYKEMQAAVDEMNNGVPEIDALFHFGTRCMTPEIKKFSSTLMQGSVKGSGELVMMLQQQSKEVWEAKRQYVRREGEKAASKLMGPILIMFLGILIMILVPIFSNMGA